MNTYFLKHRLLLRAMMLMLFFPAIAPGQPAGKGPAAMEPAVIPGDFADPSVIRVGRTFYAVGTSSEWAPHIPLFSSADLRAWKQTGYVLPQTPDWALSSFWAPEFFYADGTYYVYYVARRKSDSISCIGVATSRFPDREFTDRGVVVSWGREAIDPYLFEENGQRYITWKAYGLDDRPIELLGSRLSADGLRLEGEPFSLLKDSLRQGLEGQSLVKRNGYYYLFYSVGACCGQQCSYLLNVARSTTLAGPYTPYSGNPLLKDDEHWKCPGHGTPVQTNSGKDYFLFHAYSQKDDVFTGRQGLLREIRWPEEGGWPAFLKAAEPLASLPAPFRDDFTSATLPVAWQWDFRHAQPEVQLRNGTLHLSGERQGTNETGVALTVRPARGNYNLVTGVVAPNESLQGLVLYGDAGQSAGIGVQGGAVQVWAVQKDKRTLLATAPLTSKKGVELKMEVREGYRCRFFYKTAGAAWKELKTGAEGYFDARFLPPWDRSPRPGLHHLGRPGIPASFSYFSLTYQP
ncbi:MAG TPA: family 43 glycosylhydrolase [Chitinophagaceae bacterium]|nr:family 43 glycosylhydrolase [Chitinophagaceae bacterium]